MCNQVDGAHDGERERAHQTRQRCACAATGSTDIELPNMDSIPSHFFMQGEVCRMDEQL